ncbi:MAG: AAA family ATPase [Candidatus Tectimicrobiota bacterium]
MYLRFFNLREPPFNLTPDPRFLFLSAQHEEALTHLLYGIYERKGFIEITGEVGTGKTVLCRALLERLDDTVSTALIFNSYLSRMELLQAINDDFGLTPRDTTSKGYIDALNTYLLAEFAAGRNAVVVIDEAQNLEPTVLEQLRMLSNLETERGKLLQIVLVGQPELRDKLATVQMRQLEQRIAVRFHIHELTRAEVEQYITHRLSVAGGAHTVVWSRRALTLIHRYTGGIPRRLNLLCERILMTAFVRETHRIRAAIVHRSVRELGSPTMPRGVGRSQRLLWQSAAGLAMLSLCMAGFLWGPSLYQAWYPPLRAAAQAWRRPPAADLPPAPAPPAVQTPPESAPLPEPVLEPASPVTPLPALPTLVPPVPPVEADVGWAQALWRLKGQVEAFVTQAQSGPGLSWELLLAQAAEPLGLDVMLWQASIWQLQGLTRPCLIEMLPEAPATRPALWVLVRGLPEGILVYQEGEGLWTLPLQRLRQIWTGKLYLTLEETKYRGAGLRPGMSGERVRLLQQTLKDLGYFTVAPSGTFEAQTEQAVKRFQRDNQLAVDGRVGRRTLMMLLHVGADALASST